MSTLDELHADLQEFEKLASQSTRDKVKSVLGLEICKLRTEIAFRTEQAKETTSNAAASSNNPAERKNVGIRSSLTKLTDYAWDQSDKFVKVYVTIKHVQSVAADDVELKSTDKSFELTVSNVQNKSYSLVIKNLMDTIDPNASYHKVKTDMIVLFLRKVSSKSWPHITEQDKKSKDKSVPKFDENDDTDPSAKMMGLLKKMYDEGDDEMKRNIAKSWTESRNKP